MKKNRYRTVAAIDVGSYYLRMLIAEISPVGKISHLEDVWQPTNIGRDAFAYRRVEIKSIHETCETLKGFGKLMRDYKVKHYRAVSTTGIREAENQEYVLEQIRLRTGLQIQVINNSEERFLLYKAIRDHLPNAHRFREQGALIVSIGSGGVEISVYNQGNLRFTEYIKVGALRIRESLSKLQHLTLDFPSIMEEYLESKIYSLDPYIRQMKLKNYIGLNGEIAAIYSLCQDKKAPLDEKFISKTRLTKLYAKIRHMSSEQIALDYELSMNESEMLLPCIIIFLRFLDMTQADGIYVPLVSLRHGLLADITDQWYDTQRRKDFLADIISSVWSIGEKYRIDKVHAAHVANLVMSIFEQTKRIHRLEDQAGLYLKIAAILHDIGKFINFNQPGLNSYNAIRYQDIMGLSNQELNIVANVVSFSTEENPQPVHDNYRLLPYKDKIMVSKLGAILKLAESLDISHTQKVHQVEISTFGRDLHFKIGSRQDMLLEEWSLANNARYFEEIMGFRPIIKRRGENNESFR